jgi:hypothetical protein
LCSPAVAAHAQDYLIYRKRHRPLKVLCVDTTTKMVLIDDSAPVGDVVTAIGKKMNLKNPEEFSLMTTNLEQNGKSESFEKTRSRRKVASSNNESLSNIC